MDIKQMDIDEKCCYELDEYMGDQTNLRSSAVNPGMVQAFPNTSTSPEFNKSK